MSAVRESARSVAPVSAVLSALRAGRPALVVGEGGRTGDVVLPAALASPSWTAWAVRHTSGFLCAPLLPGRAEALELPEMVPRHEDPGRSGYTVSVDAARGVGTGISARDRARTARVLADPESGPSDLRRPGHVLPVQARCGGVLAHRGRAEAAVDLCRLAGLPPVAVIAEVVTDSGGLADRGAIEQLSACEDVPALEVADVVVYRFFHGDGLRKRVTRGTPRRLSTSHGRFEVTGYYDEVTGAEHLVVRGGPAPGSHPLVAVHAECVMGDVLGATACQCARHLDQSLTRIAADGGVLIYVRRSAGGLSEAAVTHSWDVSQDGLVSGILGDLDMSSIRLLPGPVSVDGLAPGGITVVRAVPVELS